MKPTLLVFFFFIAVSGFTQSKITGLYGKCNNKDWGYKCQQVLFKDDSTFEFYDLLHIRGWNISKGIWNRKGDTIILNSSRNPFHFEFNGTSKADSITLIVKDEEGPETLATINRINDTAHYLLNQNGIVKLSKRSLDSFYLNVFFNYNGLIVLDKEKLFNSDTLEITVNHMFHDVYYFENEKWLLKRNKLFMRKDEMGNFDRKVYFEKAALSDLRYKKKN